jgi:hypothetical protein
MDLKEIRGEDVDWINLAQGIRKAFVSIIMNFQVLYVGTPTYQRISFLSQQHSHCLAPASAPLHKQPFSGVPANGPFCPNE